MSSIELIPCSLVPMESLYEVLYLGGAAATWRTRGRTVSMEVFASLIMANGDASFGVVDKAEGGRLVGHVGLYNYDQVSGVASLAAFFDQRVASHDWIAAIGLRTFLDYVFNVIGLRKIHFEMPDSRQRSLRNSVERLPVVRAEGVLKGHVRIGSEYCDMLQFAVWSDDFAALGVDLADENVEREFDQSGYALVQACLGEMGYIPDDQLSGGVRLVEDLGLDSLALIELWVALEDRRGWQLDDEALASVQSVQDLVELVDWPSIRGVGGADASLQ